MSHALSVGERATLRSRPVHVERYLSYVPVEVVFSGQITAHYVDSRNSNNYALGLQSTTGTLADAKPGYSVWIGTAPGLRDRSIVRMRAAGYVVGANTIIPIGEVAQAAAKIEIGEYVTIVAIRKPWPKLPRLLPVFNAQGVATDFLEYHDYDVVHTDQNRYQQPLANVTKSGYDPLEHAGFLDAGEDYRTLQLDSSTSQALTDSIASRSWDVNGQTIAVGSSSSTAITVQVEEGFHWFSLTVVTTAGKSSTHWFPVWAHGPAYPPITRVHVVRDERSEWREQDLEIFNQPGLSDLLTPGATLCSWERVTYAGEVPPPQRPTQILGWSPRTLGSLRAYEDTWTLTLVGIGGWLEAMNGYGQLIIKPDSSNVPDEWNEMALGTLRIDRVAAYILREYSTVLDLVNLYILSENTDIVEEEEIKLGTQWAQVKYQVSGYLGKVACDSGSAIWITPQAFYGSESQQAAWPAVISITAADWMHDPGLQVTTEDEPTVNQLTMSGSWFDGVKSHQVASVAPGDAMSGLGDNQEGPYQRLPTANAQQALNTRCGREYWRRNAQLNPVTVELLSDLDCVEPAWGELVKLTWEEEAASGVEWTTKSFVVTDVIVTHSYEGLEEPQRSVAWTLEAVTFGRPGMTVLLPDDPFPDTLDFPVDPPMLRIDETLPEDGLDYNQQTAAAFPRGGTEFFRTGPVFNGSGLDVDNPVWDPYDLDSDIDGEIEDFAPDPASPLYLGTGSELNGVLLTTTHAYQLLDVMSATPTIDSAHELPVNTDHTTMKRSIAFSLGVEGECAIVGHDTADFTTMWVSFSDDSGATWTDNEIATDNALDDLCIFPISFFDFADVSDVVGFAVDWICGGVSGVGTVASSTGGEGNGPSMRSGPYTSTRCSGLGIGLYAPSGYTWSITEVRMRVRWEADAGWGTLPIQVLMSHDHPFTGTHATPNMFNSGWPSSSISLTEGAGFETIALPSSYAGNDIGSIRIDMSVDVGGVPAANVNWYADNIAVYGTMYEISSGDPVPNDLGLAELARYPGVWLSPINSGRIVTSWPRADSGGLAYALCVSDDGGATCEDLEENEWVQQGAQDIQCPISDESESNFYHGFAACLPPNEAAGVGFTQLGNPISDASPVEDGIVFGFTSDHVHPISISRVDGLILIVVACSRDGEGNVQDYGVFITHDGGVTWEPLIPSGPSVNVRSCGITADGEHWFGWGAHGFVGVSTSSGFSLLDKTGNMPDLLIARVVGG